MYSGNKNTKCFTGQNKALITITFTKTDPFNTAQAVAMITAKAQKQFE